MTAGCSYTFKLLLGRMTCRVMAVHLHLPGRHLRIEHSLFRMQAPPDKRPSIRWWELEAYIEEISPNLEATS